MNVLRLKIILLCLASLALGGPPAKAQDAAAPPGGCSVDVTRPLTLRVVFGYSDRAQWVVVWNEAQDVGQFTVDEAGVQRFALTHTVCYAAGKKLSFGTLGARVQAIRTAADPQAALAAAWVQYVKTPLTDPSMAAVLADFRADACARLPFTLQVCQ